MKLIDLKPQFYDHGGNGSTDKDGNPLPERTGIGIMFECACGKDDCWNAVPFLNPIDGGPPLESNRPNWKRTGESFDTLTLSPSILRSTKNGGCGWHGWIRNGEVISCG